MLFRSRLNGELGRLMKQPELQERYLALGVAPEHGTPQELTEAIRSRTQQMAKVLRDAGVQPE